MVNDNFNDYEIADLIMKNKSDITELEKSICEETNKDIVLIAYQNKNKAGD